MAPELYENDYFINFEDVQYTDIFSLGVMLFTLLFSYPVFSTTELRKGCPGWKAI
jgi:DNA-binding helix-hairpin-helix protein with protein kinase domain